MTAYEHETIILFNDAEKEASIYTHNKAWQRYLEGKLGLVPTEHNSENGRTYTLLKKWIKKPRHPKTLSEGQRQSLPERFKKRVPVPPPVPHP